MLGDKLAQKILAARDGRPVAVAFDPMTGVPDAEGYRPRESELPQQQPVAEVIQYEVAGETADDVLAQVMAAHAARKTTKEDEDGSI